MVRTKPGQKIHVDTLNIALSKLEQLETKPKSELNLRESIFFLKDKLNSALKKGYSYQDLSEVLESQKILISAATLKQYLTDMSKKKSSSGRKRDKSVSSSSSSSGHESSSSSNAKLDAQTSINVTDSIEELAHSNSPSEINRMEGSNSSDSKGSKSIKAKANTKVKPKVFSGFDDDLSADFND
ncbi:MAG: hypothetical protein RLZZ574_1130 [Cyanobacteriota bacterium]|jgi:hypothetical protein